MGNEGDIDWDVFFNESPNEQSTLPVMDTTIPNPGSDTISDSNIAALETWVQENSTADMDAPDCLQDHSQSPQNRRLYRPHETLSALGQSIGFDNLASEMQRLRKTIYNESETLRDFSKMADDAHAKVDNAHAKVEEASSMVDITLQRASRLKAVYDQLIQCSHRSVTYSDVVPRWRTVAVWPQMIFLPMPDPKSDQSSGLENYLFDRYMHTLLRIFILLGLTLLPILLPINLGGKSDIVGVKGLDRLSFSNVGFLHPERYWAHLVSAIFVAISVCLILQAELRSYSRFEESLGAQSTGSSILLVSSSKKPLDPEAIRRHFSTMFGGVQGITINRDFRLLDAKISRLDAWIAKLEAAETELVRKASRSKGMPAQPLLAQHSLVLLWKRYLLESDRPTMRASTSWWKQLFGPRVDTIHYCRSKIVQCSLEIERDNLRPHAFPSLNSAFVHFNHRLSDPLSLLTLSTRSPSFWTIKQGATHGDIIWANLPIRPWERWIRTVIVYFLFAGLIFGYALPVTVTGAVSQVTYLVGIIPGLAWLETLPSWMVPAIQGILPPVMLAIWISLVPIALRVLVNFQKLHSHQAEESSVQRFYFIFLFIQVFLVASLSSSITTVLGGLGSSAKSVPVVLAQNLPKASNYFFSYFILKASSTISITLICGEKLLNLLLSNIRDKTARQKWTRSETLNIKLWGTFVPVYTNLACIGLVYSVIAPLILLFSVIVFGALWILYRSHPPKLSDSVLRGRGQFYPTAIRQLFTGLYFMELCLGGLFCLVRDSNDEPLCTAQAIAMIFLVLFTLIFQCTMGYWDRLSWRSARGKITFHRDQEKMENAGILAAYQGASYGFQGMLLE
ncbi:hypothetical protein V493_01829 [Pseudogymnoascus sp. VKM F-4281 (FW-2241)]|nr:hypothetical protein V493_01829 [Pseudogymnoascus sp. VKM F-4281 (FW-2241)]